MTRLRRASSQSPLDLILSAYLENHPNTPDPARLRQAVAQTLAELAPGPSALAEALAQAARRLRDTTPAIGQRYSETKTPQGDVTGLEDVTDLESVEGIESSEADEPPRTRRRVRQTASPQDHAMGQSELAFEFQPEERPAAASGGPASPVLAEQARSEADDPPDAVASTVPAPAPEPEAEAVERAPRKRKRPSRPASRRRKASVDSPSAEEPDIDRITAPGVDTPEPASQAEPDSDSETQPLRHTAESVFQNFPQSENVQPRPIDRPGGGPGRRHRDE
jgi:hypothetical protein